MAKDHRGTITRFQAIMGETTWVQMKECRDLVSIQLAIRLILAISMPIQRLTKAKKKTQMSFNYSTKS